MPYPFSQLPTFAELQSILENDFGCEFKRDLNFVNQDGDFYTVTYFERVIGNEILDCVVVFPEDESERIKLDFLRHIISRLRIDPARFGLDLDYFDSE